MKAQWPALALQVLERFDSESGAQYKVITKGGEAVLRDFLVLRLKFTGRHIKDTNAVNALWTKIGNSKVEHLQQDYDLKRASIYTFSLGGLFSPLTRLISRPECDPRARPRSATPERDRGVRPPSATRRETKQKSFAL